MFKKTIGFLTLAAFSVISTGCSSGNIEQSSLSDSSAESSADENSSSESLPVQAEQLSNTVEGAYSELFSDRDKAPDFDNITAEIKLNGDSAECAYDGVSIEGTAITVAKEGVYRVSGTLNDGQIVVNADKAKVQLILDNADITCKTSSPIYGADSDKIFISLAENSVNTLTDGSSYTYADEEKQEPDACIFSRDSITINGSGTLNVNANFADGIRSRDDVVITGGNINVTSEGDGVKGKDYVAVCGGKINIKSGGDGIKSTQKDDTSLGFVYIEGGEFLINAEQDGIQAETKLIIAGGEFDVTSGGGHENSNKTHNDMDFGGGRGFGGGDRKNFGDMTPPDGFDFDGMTPPDGFDFDNMTPPDDMQHHGRFDFGEMTPPDMNAEQTAYYLANTVNENNDSTDTAVSAKGLKGGALVEISGGNITVDSADDTVHSNGDVQISGGFSTLCAGDDGIHADETISITDGSVVITESYEGIEGKVINVSGGDVQVSSKDDGFNAADGTAQGGMGTYSGGAELNISGGFVYVDAEGDGLDSNGDMTISGGTILINGPTNGGNGALDGNSEIVVTGGLIVAAGSSQMAVAPGESSTQYSISASIGSTQEKDTLVTLLDSEGGEVVSFKPAKTFDHIVISSPDIEKGRTYTLSIGGSTASAGGYGLFENGGYDGKGTSVGSFTAENITSYIGQQSMMGGGFGGHGGGKDFQPPTDENGDFVKPDIPNGGFDRGKNFN